MINEEFWYKEKPVEQLIEEDKQRQFQNYLKERCQSFASQTCSVCGYVNKDIKNLAVREMFIQMYVRI